MMLQTNQKANLLLNRYMFPNREHFQSVQSSREKVMLAEVEPLHSKETALKSRGLLCLRAGNETYSSTFIVFLFLFQIIANANSRFGEFSNKILISFSCYVSVK